MGMDMYTTVQVVQNGDWVTIDKKNAPGLHRNYALFGLLGPFNRTGKPVKTILQSLYGDDAERNPPTDLTTEVVQDYIPITKYYDANGMYVMDDEGGLYWYTLDELLNFDWQGCNDEGHTWAEVAGVFHREFIPWMQRLGEPEQVRLLFGFSF